MERSERPTIEIRRATRADVGAIVHMLADDMLGQGREQVADPLPEAYFQSFEAIERDPQHELVVMEAGGEVVGTLQLTFLPSMSFVGAMRAQIESVRVAREYRGRGIGQQLMAWAVARACERGCRFVQLTTNADRADAHRFYERLGFVPSHIGMKLDLGPPTTDDRLTDHGR